MRRHTRTYISICPLHANTYTYIHIYHLLGRGARKSGGKIHEMSVRLSSWSFLLRRTQTHTQCNGHLISSDEWHFLSLSFSIPSPALRRCGDKISIPFPPLLLPPSTAGQEVRTTGTKERRERDRETKRKMGTKEDIKRKKGKKRLSETWRQRNKQRAECDRQRETSDSKTKTARCNEREQKEKYSKWTESVERMRGEIYPQGILITMTTLSCLLCCPVAWWTPATFTDLGTDKISSHYCSPIINLWL